MPIRILAAADAESSQRFTALIANTKCSVCPMTADDLALWDSGDEAVRHALLRAYVVEIEKRGDESAIFHDPETLLVCLGRKGDLRWEFLPFDLAQRVCVRSLVSSSGTP
jgi:hypothetical protein